MKTETPKTDAAEIEVCHTDETGGGWLKAVPAVLARELEKENRLLRQGCSLIASSIGNGSAASPDASVDFLTNALANEVKLYCERLRSKAGDGTARPNDQADRLT